MIQSSQINLEKSIQLAKQALNKFLQEFNKDKYKNYFNIFQIFGLLGVNGAGKTSTFKILTGDIVPSSGQAYIDSHNIINE